MERLGAEWRQVEGRPKLNTIPESYQPEKLLELDEKDVHEIIKYIDPAFRSELLALNNWAEFFRGKDIPFRIEENKKTGKWGLWAERKAKSDTYQRKPKMQ